MILYFRNFSLLKLWFIIYVKRGAFWDLTCAFDVTIRSTVNQLIFQVNLGHNNSHFLFAIAFSPFDLYQMQTIYFYLKKSFEVRGLTSINCQSTCVFLVIKIVFRSGSNRVLGCFLIVYEAPYVAYLPLGMGRCNQNRRWNAPVM